MSQAGLMPSATFISDCFEAGFALAGVAPADFSAHHRSFETWLDEGLHGSMAWMLEHREVRLDPDKVLPGARSIICVADRYPQGVDPGEDAQASSGRIADYAAGRDYHRVMKKRLHALCDAWRERWPEAAFRACVDTAPMLEREAAVAAGLGRIGKNTMLIEPGVGSRILLGEVLTTLAIADTPGRHDDPCGTCTRCIEACPTDALTPWRLDARRCISALTIENRHEIEPTWHSGIGSWLFGCDACQDACPHNEATHRTQSAEVNEAYVGTAGVIPVAEVLDWTGEDRHRHCDGRALGRATLDMWRRNAAIVAGNILAVRNDAAIRTRLERMVADPDESPMVVQAARTSLARAPA